MCRRYPGIYKHHSHEIINTYIIDDTVNVDVDDAIEI